MILRTKKKCKRTLKRRKQKKVREKKEQKIIDIEITKQKKEHTYINTKHTQKRHFTKYIISNILLFIFRFTFF